MIKYRGRDKTPSDSSNHDYLFKLPRVAGSAEQIQSPKIEIQDLFGVQTRQSRIKILKLSFPVFAWFQGPGNDMCM